MKHEKSCGVIIVNEDKVLLIKTTNNDWGFPKGHTENSESEIDTALREVKEETNLDVEIIKNKKYLISYNPKENVYKEVVYFIGIIKNHNEINLQPEEILEYQWVPMAKVSDFLSFSNIKELYKEALQDIVLDSKRIKYVNISKNYLEDYIEMVNNPEVNQYITLKNRTITYEDEEKLNNRDLIFTMVDKLTNEFIGNIELKDLNEKNVEVGICITLEWQNKHYGYEALKTLLKYAFEVLNLEEVLLSFYSHNLRGKHLYEKLGFEVYQVDKNCGVKNGQIIDDIYMKITRDNYKHKIEK